MKDLSTLFTEQVKASPTEGQLRFFQYFDAFWKSAKPRCTLILKGYAGTGKTTVLKSILAYLGQLNSVAVLMAPTGRAAKVMGNYTNTSAFTIHKTIYQRRVALDGASFTSVKANLFKDTLFVVDEASMIQAHTQDDEQYGGKNLLSDLIEYVFSGINCKLLLLGDTAQLPPVGSDKSRALEKDWLRDEFDLCIAETELNEVMRQALNSGILSNATELRELIIGKEKQFSFLLNFPDIKSINGLELQDELENAIANYGLEDVLLITKSNKRANLFNQQVRNRMLYFDEELVSNDYLMVVKNNYHWLAADSNNSYIANGDVVQVKKIKGFDEQFNLRFADVVLYLVDFGIEFDAKILLDTLSSETPALPAAQSAELFAALQELYAGEGSKKKIFEKIKADPYYNALQVKFAYAVTCHKSQGGQWPVVFIDQGFLPDDKPDVGFYRWLYTAITRASEQVFLLNFSPQFLPEID